ncbi:DUF3048 domain-containing protein [Streptomyces sp. Ru73]|uniref:DUF3048 domain-containing protein n=1 Tax=Streptomyces sp. Ru73 TaxID=2080748 RepID=UPI000CDD3763|nr:DUF3048 domain-containing protein [Streptomyces sp. Ru73]POX40759.1 DUF3048 domain-containing protein [Streptomyces sp. Ru73]
MAWTSGTGWTGSRRAVLAAGLAAGLSPLVAGCQAGDGDGRSPFTGERGAGDKVLAVKIDNVSAARPQTGLEDADILYTEQVEAGLSRILAVFAAHLPDRVGPVRSARESDLELLRQFGHPALAYSGAQAKLRPTLESAPIDALPPGKAPGAYVRSTDRAAPHNLYLRPARALDAASGAAAPADIGFRFGSAPSGGTPATQQEVRYPAARFSFSWSGERKRWLVSMDGTPFRTTGAGQLGVATVVIQYVTVRSSRLHDKWGSVTPYTETVGSGDALVLRDGKKYQAQWSRPAADGGTTFTTPEGHRMPFARGPLWVALTPKG